MIQITEGQTRILEALGQYKYLTASQLEQIGVSSSRQVIWREIRRLSETPTKKTALVGVIRFPASMRMEHVESMYYLTRPGAVALAELLCVDLGELSFQDSSTVFHRDYWHRKYCVDFHILLNRALQSDPLGLEIAVWDRYFDKIGANRAKARRGALRAKTRVDLKRGYLIPDVNFVLQSREDAERKALFSLEMTNGKDTKRALEKIARHIAVMRVGVLGEKYGLAQNYQALFLFAEQSLLEAVSTRFEEAGVEGFRRLFWFGWLGDVQHDVLASWHRPNELGTAQNFITGKARS